MSSNRAVAERRDMKSCRLSVVSVNLTVFSIDGDRVRNDLAEVSNWAQVTHRSRYAVGAKGDPRCWRLANALAQLTSIQEVVARMVRVTDRVLGIFNRRPGIAEIPELARDDLDDPIARVRRLEPC